VKSFLPITIAENFMIYAVILKLYQVKVFAVPLGHQQQRRIKEIFVTTEEVILQLLKLADKFCGVHKSRC
jgi:hypothetical protein